MATIRDIANAAGVSISTVSHVVNKTRYVSPELVERVEQAITSLNSTPNFIVKKRTAEQMAPILQFVLLVNIGSKDITFEESVNKELSVANLVLVSMSCKNDIEKSACLELAKIPNCVGIIFWVANDTAPLDPEFTNLNLPLVVAGLTERSEQENIVFSDIAAGTLQAILHLLRSGHEQIAFLGIDETAALSAYQATLEDFHIPYCDSLVYLGLHEEPNLFSALDDLFRRKLPPTALFVAHTNLIVPLLRYLETNTIRCPEDVSVVCLGDFEWSTLYKPAITTVPIGRAKIARYAVEQLRQQIVHRKCASAAPVRFPTKLLMRASTAGIPRGPFGERGAEPCTLQLTFSERAAIVKGKYTAAVSFHSTGFAYDNLFMKGLLDVFRPLGINIIATTDAHFDPALQSRQLETFSHLQPSIVIGFPTDDSLTTEPFRNLIGTSKLLFLEHIPQGFTPKDYVSCISNNNQEYGRYAAQALAERMHQNGLSNVGMLMRSGQFFSTHQRDTSAEQLFSERSDINLVAISYFELEHNVYNVTLDLMRHHPEINGLYVSWEGPAMEALRALQELGRTDVIISTCGLEYKSAMVFAGKGMIQCITAQKPFELGRAAAMSAAISLLGRDVPSYIAVGPVRVTHTNLLKVWKEIYKENAPEKLRDCLRQTVSYTELGMD